MDLLALYRRAKEANAKGIIFGRNSITELLSAMGEQGKVEWMIKEVEDSEQDVPVGMFITIPVYVSKRLQDGYYFKR